MTTGPIRWGWLLLVGTAMLAVVTNRVAVAQAPPPGSVTFSRDVLPILQKHCQSCHRPGQIGPMSFLDYTTTRPWARAIKTKVVARLGETLIEAE